MRSLSSRSLESSWIEERYKPISNVKQNVLSISRALQIAVTAQTVPFANYFQLGGLGNALRKKEYQPWKLSKLRASENKGRGLCFEQKVSSGDEEQKSFICY